MRTERSERPDLQLILDGVCAMMALWEFTIDTSILDFLGRIYRRGKSEMSMRKAGECT